MKRWMALLVLCAVSAVLVGCGQDHAEFKHQLALMRSTAQTGANQEKFLERMAELRAAYAECSVGLSQSQREGFEKIEEHWHWYLREMSVDDERNARADLSMIVMDIDELLPHI
jgi:hypothetical protein